MGERRWVAVSEIMHTDVTEIDGNMTIDDAVKIMRKSGAHCLIVERRHEHDEYGMLLLSDIAKQVIGKNRAPERVNVHEIMAKPVIWVRPEMDLRYCARLFERFGLAYAPVIDANHAVVGIISSSALALEALPHLE
jgi:predicted transcriptional regulator